MVSLDVLISIAKSQNISLVFVRGYCTSKSHESVRTYIALNDIVGANVIALRAEIGR